MTVRGSGYGKIIGMNLGFLRISLQVLFCAAGNPDIMLADVFTEDGWDFQFRRNPFEREMQEIDLEHVWIRLKR